MTLVEDEAMMTALNAIEAARTAAHGGVGRERRSESEHGGMLALEVENMRLKKVVAELLMKNQQLREQLRATGV
jgi:hypothetical protein